MRGRQVQRRGGRVATLLQGAMVLLLLMVVVMRRGLASAARCSACCRACSRGWPEYSIRGHLCVALLQYHHAGLLLHEHR
jgi:hypothetical protein